MRANFMPLLVLVFLVVQLSPALVDGATAIDRDLCLERTGEQGVQACRLVLQSTPDDLQCHIRLGDLLLQLMRYREAAAVFREAQSIFPGSQELKHKLEMADSLHQEQEWLQQRKYEKTNKAVVHSTKTQIELNRIKCTRMQGSKGLAACEEALKAAPDDPQLHHSRGNILLEMGRVAEAKAAFMSALGFDPDNKEYAIKVAALNSVTKTNASTGEENRRTTAKAESTSTEPPSTNEHDIVERMALLKSLREQKLIDDDEFDRRKKRLLDTAFADTHDRMDKTSGGPPAADYFGNYYALLIGIQNYRYLTPLKTVHKDVVDISAVLEKDYGFKVETLHDASRRKILLALGRYRQNLTAEDNLLIYYAGHGWLDQEADAGYWLPVDALQDSDVDWLSLSAVTAAIRAMPAKHVMIVADSCYSGKLTRGVHIKQKSPNYLQRMAKKKTRVVMTSGGLEPVLDSGGADGHSVFASVFLRALRENREIVDSTTLFTQIRRPVMLNATQTPEYADIRKAGHEGGDFIFIRR